MNKEIEQWLNGGRDYDEGVALFIKYGGNRSQARVFQNTVARFAIKSLTYELTKLAKKTTSAPVAEKKVAKPTTKKAQKPKDDIPEVVGKVKNEIHNIWVKLSRQHLDLFETGEENTPELMAERVKIMAERTPLMERYNQLYEAKESYFAGDMTLQELEDIFECKPKEESKADVPQAKEMSDLEITKRLHALKTNITRSQNRLDYQQEKKGKEKKPMPDCPKRKKIEAKLNEMKAEYDTLQAEAKKRGLNGKA